MGSTRSRGGVVGLLVAVAGLGACGKSPSAGNTAATSTSAMSSAGHPASADADAESPVRELAKGALACPWQSGFALSCPAYMKWLQAREGASGVARGIAAEGVLVTMVEDPDPKVRYLGASSLAHGLAAPWRQDPGLAKRVVAAARNETDPALAVPFGQSVAGIDFGVTGTLESVKGILHTHPLVNLRTSLIDQMMLANITNDAVFDLPRELLKDDDPKIRVAAISAFVHNQGAVRRLADICKLMLDNIENPDLFVAATAGGNLTRIGNKGCPGAYDTLLDSLDKRVKAKSFGDYDDFAMGPGRVCEDKTATPAQKTHAIAVLRGMASLEPTKWHQVRYFALDSMVTCDPDGSKKWLAGFAADKDERVKHHAADLLARLR